ncbi:MAG: isoaspartyl peptidase/L-asparaginase family protein [Sphingobacteriaceae bacterium]
MNARLICFVLTASLFFSSTDRMKAQQQKKESYVMVIHGGAGTILRSQMTAEKEAAYKAKLTEALQTGYNLLKAGKSSLDAVEATVRIMEDSPLFNAGKGAVFTHDGKNELDAAIMDGATLRAGSIAGVTTIKNPISTARAVMEKSEHVMLTGTGAEKFAKEVGQEIVDPSYFKTQSRWDALQKVLKEDSIAQKDKKSSLLGIQNKDNKFGTVGAVALDQQGHLAAATSTGGMTNKKYGRVGDAPLIGIGTYANNQVGISCTGWGEFFIRNVVAHEVAALMAYKGLSIKEATNELIFKKVPALGGDGGLIALDKDGNAALPFNTEGMYRGTVTKEGKIEVFIYKD